MIPRSKAEAQALHLVLWPNAILREKCKDVDPTELPNLGFLIARMQDVMVMSGGVGLAAPQVGVPLRIFIISSILSSPLGAGLWPNVFVNPVVWGHADKEDMSEGCLSLPGLYSNIRRSTVCHVRADNLPKPIVLTGRAAQVAQHEFDHLRGKLQLARHWRG